MRKIDIFTKGNGVLNQWQYETSLMAESLKEAKEKFCIRHSLDSSQVKALFNFEARVLKERMKSLDNCGVFQQVFKTRLKPFWDGNILGFNVIAFDAWLDVPDGVSTNHVIMERYGQAGIDVINALLA